MSVENINFRYKISINNNMQISWYGQSCFKIISGGTTIIMDPFSKKTGLTPPRGKADVLLVSDASLDPKEYSQIEAGFTARGAGEYEVGGILIQGIPIIHKEEKGSDAIKISTIFVIDVEDTRICHLSDASEDQVMENLDKIGQIDILMLPVGGSYKYGKGQVNSMGAQKAVEILGEIEPRAVIPMNFKLPKLTVDFESEDKFLKLVGAADTKATDKFTIKKRELPSEGRMVVLMNTQIS